jgi:hypothetical protein
LTISVVDKREEPSAKSSTATVSNEGDFINYQLRIFPSKHIKQSLGELTEQNSENSQ